jgi:23S rRNA pseudouridine1911/1915/1917 synthase
MRHFTLHRRGDALNPFSFRVPAIDSTYPSAGGIVGGGGCCAISSLRPAQSAPPYNFAMTLLPADAVLFEDHHLIAVNKPAPLLTQAPPGIPSLETLVKEYIKEKYAKPAGVYLGVPHRLDRPVSGVVIFARNTKAAQRVHAQFHDRTVKKVYWAAVEGDVLPANGIWEDWIRKVEGAAAVTKAEPHEPGGKLATLEYRVLQTVESGTLLELIPRTGRMHQLRVQCAWRGHPVLGDALYGSTVDFGPTVEEPRDRIIALHARRLELVHPFAREIIAIEAPLPTYWQASGPR